MASRRKKARELAEMTPANAIAALKGNLYRTHAQKASAKNFEETTAAIVIFIRKKYPDTADEIASNREVVLVRPIKPRKPKKRKTRIKEDDDGVGFETPKTSKKMKVEVAAPPSGASGMFEAKKILIDDDDSSSDDSEDTAEYNYQMLLEDYQDERKEYRAKKLDLSEGRKYARDIILAQCTREMKEKLKVTDTFEDLKTNSNVIGLLALIRTCGLDFSDEGYLFQNQIHILRDLLTFRQGREMSNHTYRDGIDARVQKFEQMGGTLAKLFKTKDKKYAECTPEEIRERILAVITVDQACGERFADFKKQRSDDAHLGRDDFPATRSRAAIAMDNHHNAPLKPRPTLGTDRDDATNASSFAQVIKGKDRKPCVPGTDGKVYPDIKCWECKAFGHKSWKCPVTNGKKKKGGNISEETAADKDSEAGDSDDQEDAHNHHLWFSDPEDEAEYEGVFNDTTFSNQPGESKKCFATLQSDVCLPRTSPMCLATETEFKKRMPRVPGQLLILLDTGANAHVFNNSAFLRNIRPAPVPIPVSTQAGNFLVDQMGDFPGYGPVYYHKEAIINVLSMGLLEYDDKFNVTHRSRCFTVKNLQSKKIMRFPLTKGIYVTRVDPGLLYSSFVKSNNGNVNAYVLATVTTVAKNEAAHPRRDVTKAKAVLPLIQALGYPSRKDLRKMIRLKSVGNCPVTVADVDRFYEIYGGVEGAIKGKTVRKTPVEVDVDENVVEIPREITARLGDVTLSLDIFFVDRMPFLTSISRKIMYSTSRALASRQHGTVFEAIMEIISFYNIHGKEVKHIMSDNEFGPLKARIREEGGADLNLAAPNEHVPEIERNIRIIKERLRCTLTGMPYKKVPRNFKRELVLSCTTMLNTVPREAGASDTLSPMELLTGRTLDFNRHCKLAPGTYCLVHEENTPTNTMEERATGAIAIGPTANMQGSYRFLSLRTGQIITRRSWNEMPVTPEAIAIVEEMAGEDGNMVVTFEYRGTTYSTADEAPLDDDENENAEEMVAGNEEEIAPTVEPTEVENAGGGDENDEATDENEVEPGADVSIDGAAADEVVIGGEDIEDGNVAPLLAEHAADPQGPAARTRSNTATTGRRYFFRLEDEVRVRNEQHFLWDWDIAKVFTQVSHRKGIRLFDRRAEIAVIKELSQFKSKQVLIPIGIQKMTPAKVKKALRLIMVIKEKRDGSIKGRGVCDGSGQRQYICEFDAASPTVSTEGLAMSCAIDAFERRFVSTVDIPGAYLHCTMDSEEYVFLEDSLVDLYLEMDPSARSKVTVGRDGRKKLYTRMNKALYGHMRSGRLFYEHISDTLAKMGFVCNPDELCVWNRDVNGKQMTVVLYVDDLKVSFHTQEGIDEFILGLEKTYGALEPKKGKVFDYCGITLDYTTEGVCRLSTTKYIKEALETFRSTGRMVKKGAKTPARVNLFEIREETDKLEEKLRKVFHSVFAKLLWVGIKTRPDILVALSFLGKRTTVADEDDWTKLERLLSYLESTINMPLTLGIDDLHIVKWWADAAFGVHKDLKSHSGLLASLGRGAIYARSSAQKLNTTSSTESEVVAGSEALAQALWTSSFLRNQECPPEARQPGSH